MPTPTEPVMLTPEEIKRRKKSSDNRTYYELHRDELIRYLRQYRLRNKAKLKSVQDEKRRLNPAHFEAINRKYEESEKGKAARNRHEKTDQRKAAKAEYRKTEKFKSLVAISKKQYRASEQGKKHESEYAKSPKGIIARMKCGRARRARKLNATVGNPKVIAAWEKTWRFKRSVKCYWCPASVSGRRAHIDHVIAISKGGSHSVENLCISCPSCNLRKSTKPLVRWNLEIEQPVLL